MKHLITLATILYLPFLFSQNFDRLKEKKIVKVGGSLILSTKYMSSFNDRSIQNPFTWCLNGSINASILDIQLPFTFSYSNLGTEFTQPNIITSFDPKYKWFQGHLGLTNMNISKNTFSGRPFLGGGFELKFKKLEFKFLFGRLTKAIEYDQSEENINNYSYKRMAIGFSAKYELKNQILDIAILKTKDDQNSLSSTIINGTILPKDNFIVDFNGRFKFLKILQLNFNYALSIITDNLNIESNSKSRFWNFLIQENISTSYNHMIYAELIFNLKNKVLGFSYQRTDPNFISLGNYFTNNNYERYHANMKLNFFKNKWNLNLKLGLQKNGLIQKISNSSLRMSISAQTSIIPFKRSVISISYNNFTTSTIGKDPTNPNFNPQFDSLKVFSSTQNANLSWSIRFGTKDKTQNFSLNSNFQEIISFQGILSDIQLLRPVSSDIEPSYIITNTLVYSKANSKSQFNFQIGAFYSAQIRSSFTSLSIGPSASISLGIEKELLSLSLSSNYNFNKNSITLAHLVNNRLTLKLSPKFKNDKFGKINLNLSSSWLINIGDKIPDHQLTVFLQLGYTI